MIHTIRLTPYAPNLIGSYRPDSTVLVELDAVDAPFEVRLPDVDTARDVTFQFKKIDKTGNAVTLLPQQGQFLDDASKIKLSKYKGTITLVGGKIGSRSYRVTSLKRKLTISTEEELLDAIADNVTTVRRVWEITDPIALTVDPDTVIIPANVVWTPQDDAVLSWSGGNPTFNCSIPSSIDWQIFSCAAADAPRISRGIAWPEWFGSITAGEDHSVAMQCLVNATYQDRVPCHFHAKDYRFDQLNCVNKPIIFVGSYAGGTRFWMHADTGHMFNMVNTSWNTHNYIENIQFIGGTALGTPSANSCFNIDYMAMSVWQNCLFSNFNWAFYSPANQLLTTSRILNCVFGSYNNGGIFWGTNAEFDNIVSDCWFDENFDTAVYLDCYKTTIQNSHFKDNTGYHIIIGSGRYNKISNNTFSGGSGAVQTNIGIRVYGDDNAVIGNFFDATHATNDILISSGADNNHFANVHLSQSKIVDAGTGNYVEVIVDGVKLINTNTSAGSGYKLQILGSAAISGDWSAGGSFFSGDGRFNFGGNNNAGSWDLYQRGTDLLVRRFDVDETPTTKATISSAGALSVPGRITTDDTTDATSTTDGSLQTDGGLSVAKKGYFGDNVELASGKVYKINAQQVVGARAAALTPQLTTITHTAPGTPDYALQDLVDSGVGSAFGFATKDEGNTLLSVVANLQTRVAELEARLSAAAGHGLIADP